MVNINNSKVNVGAVVNVNKEEEMKVVNNNQGVKNKWIERIEAYVAVKNGRTLTSLIDAGTLDRGSWEVITGENVEVKEDIHVGDGWVLSIVKVDNLTIKGNPGITKGLRVYIHDERGSKLEETLYLAVDDDGVIGRDDVVYDLKGYEDVVVAANHKARTFIGEWMGYFKVDVCDVELDDLIKFHIASSRGKNSFDAIYNGAVEWLMYQIKCSREMDARLDDDRIYDVDWEFNYIDVMDIEEVKVADDLNVDHDCYGTFYLSVDEYEQYKELDEGYGVLEDFKMNPGKYTYGDRFSSDDWESYFGYNGDEVYNEFMSNYGYSVPVVLLADWLERGSYTDEITKIIRRSAARSMYSDLDGYTEYPKSITETESGIYLSIIFGGFRATIEVESINYTYQDELSVVAELSDTISGYYDTDVVDGYEQRVVNK